MPEDALRRPENGRWIDKTFADALIWAEATNGDREALVSGETRWTYRELAEAVWDFARGLIALGVQPQDHVALWMSDGPDWLVARWAVPAIGAVLVPINTRFRDHELRFVLRQSDSRVLILRDGWRATRPFDILGRIVADVDRQDRDHWRSEALPQLRSVISAGSAPPASVRPFAEVAASGARLRRQDDVLQRRLAAVRPGDVAQILYTSGTTSFPKGAMVCHGPLLQNNFNAIERLNLTRADRYLASIPLFSATGSAFTLTMFLVGGTLVLLDRYDVEGLCRIVERERITAGFFPEPIVQDLMHFPARKRFDLSTLRSATGLPLSKASARWLVEDLGVRHYVGVYGLSESTNAACRSQWDDPLEMRITTVGRPSPGVSLSIRDLESGAAVGPGQVGEIWLKGYTIMRGYYNLPDETAKAIDPDGWFHTGDLGELTAEGRVVFRGRIKEMIKPGGFNVATLEIEDFIKSHPAVKECFVVGVPDSRYGEVPFAYVELRPDKSAGQQELIAYCQAHIAGFKVPKHVEFVTEWPRTASGKPQKLELKRRAAASLLESRRSVSPAPSAERT